MDQAQAELATVGRRLALEYPDTHARLRAEVVTMPVLAMGQSVDAGSERWIYLGQLGTILLLMIVCGNVSIMILARTAQRSGELAVRTALGASRVRIVSQLFVEALVLALLATGLGLLLANWSLRQLETIGGHILRVWRKRRRHAGRDARARLIVRTAN